MRAAKEAAMTDPWLVIAGIVALAVGYVLIPVVADAFARFRTPRHLRCPETGARAQVEVDAGHAALTAAIRVPVARVKRCSLWPERLGCAQRCLGTSEAETTAPVQNA
jgi:hypothetical protein